MRNKRELAVCLCNHTQGEENLHQYLTSIGVIRHEHSEETPPEISTKCSPSSASTRASGTDLNSDTGLLNSEDDSGSQLEQSSSTDLSNESTFTLEDDE